MAMVILAICSTLQAFSPPNGERLSVEPCRYADSQAAQLAWKPAVDTAPVELAGDKTPEGGAALRFACTMSSVKERVYWDRTVDLDLSRFSRITFWVKLDGDPAAVSYCTLYFNAGNGWYSHGFGVPDAQWQRIVLERGGFRPEGSPEGWNRIRGIRLSFWKGLDRRATVLLGGMEAEAAAVLVVRNTRGGAETHGWADRMTEMLKKAGISAGVVDDIDVEDGVLRGRRLVVYPYNPQVSGREAQELEAFVAAGGRILACYSLPGPLAALLGLADPQWIAQERSGQFAVMRFSGSVPPGVPSQVHQASWNITRVRPAGRNARVLAEWYDAAGKPTGCPAVILSDTGAFISHVVLDDDRAAKVQMLRALLGHLDPDLWREVATTALRNAGRLGTTWATFEEAAQGIRGMATGLKNASRVEALVRKAAENHAKAAQLLQSGRYHEVIAHADTCQEALADAFAAAQSPRPGEWRAFWCHSAYGVPGMTWDEAIALLKKHGFTAIVPNMLWAGSADYASEVLPVTERSRREGDQIQACLDACRKHGLELHVWKVNWNLGTASQEFIARMRSEGRLQKSRNGEEEQWLCPSHPANFELERDSMLEIVRKYAVDGIHFDYIRYPDESKCYCNGCRERFEKLMGQAVARWPDDVVSGGPLYEQYQEFRRQNITRLVKAVSEEARLIRPGVKVSAAVFGGWPGCRDTVGQDWGDWIRKGYLDFVCPMDYTDSNRGFRTLVRVQKEVVSGRIPLYPGIGASAPGLDPVQVIEQIRIAREEGVPGFIIFEYNRTTATEHLPRLGAGVTSTR